MNPNKIRDGKEGVTTLVSPCHLAAEDDVIMFDNDFFGISETEAAVLSLDGLH